MHSAVDNLRDSDRLDTESINDIMFSVGCEDEIVAFTTRQTITRGGHNAKETPQITNPRY